MSGHTEFSDPGQTIPSLNADGRKVNDFRQLREDFRIYPGEDGLKYQNLKLLGMGGMGIVYSGEDPTLERQVAIKILREPFRNDPDQIAKFINEARITAKIDHPNIVAVHQLGLNAHHGVYFSMRQISGETLQNVIRHLNDGDQDTLRHYTPRRLLDIFIAGCNGIAAAHEKQILHCDLKPANIMIGAFGEVLVLDWGLARTFDAPAADTARISGTPAYMAPELISGSVAKPDVLTDVYAMGTILYSILTWQSAPFDMSMEKTRMLEKIAMGKYIPLKAPHKQHLPRELAAICRKAMHLDRNCRYQSITELLNDLYNYRDNRAVKAYSPNIIYRFVKYCRRHPAIPAAMTVALITLGLFLGANEIALYMQDNTFIRASQINMQLAEDHYRRTIFNQKQNPPVNELDNPLRSALTERNILLHANQALAEYFSVLDTAARLSPARRDEFNRMTAPDIFKRILALQIILADHTSMPRNIIDRCRRWQSFEQSCRYDKRLAMMVRLIDDSMGLVRFNSKSDHSSRPGRLLMPDGTEKNINAAENITRELPAGDYKLLLDDGLKMRFRIVPGGSYFLDLPAPAAPDSGCVIAGDHFFRTVTGSEKIRCILPPFVIKKYRYPGKFNLPQAQAILERYNNGKNSWRLPYAVELQKVWNDGDFYGLPVEPGLVLLQNGDYFDPRSGEVIHQDAAKSGALYLIKVIE